jgi:hypothetical protein
MDLSGPGIDVKLKDKKKERFYRAQIEKEEFKQQHQLMSPRFSLDPVVKKMEEDDLVICRGGMRVMGL